MLAPNVSEKRGDIEVGYNDAHGAALPRAVGLRDDGPVRASDFDVSLEVAVEVVKLVGYGLGESRLPQKAPDQVRVEPIEEFLVIKQCSHDWLACEIGFFDLDLEVPSIGNVLALSPATLLGLVKPSFLPRLGSVPHDSVDQAVKHTKNGNASVLAWGKCLSFGEHRERDMEIGVGKDTFFFRQVFDSGTVLPRLYGKESKGGPGPSVEAG